MSRGVLVNVSVDVFMEMTSHEPMNTRHQHHQQHRHHRQISYLLGAVFTLLSLGRSSVFGKSYF